MERIYGTKTMKKLNDEMFVRVLRLTLAPYYRLYSFIKKVLMIPVYIGAALLLVLRWILGERKENLTQIALTIGTPLVAVAIA